MTSPAGGPPAAPVSTPGRPIRGRSVVFGILTPVVPFLVLNVVAAVWAINETNDPNYNPGNGDGWALFFTYTIAVAVISLLSVAGGVLVTFFGDRGYGIGLLCGWALGLVVGAGACLALVGAVQT